MAALAARMRLGLRTGLSAPLLLILSHHQAVNHVRQHFVEFRRQFINLRWGPVVPFRDREPVRHIRVRRACRPGASQEEVGESVGEEGVFGRLLSITRS